MLALLPPMSGNGGGQCLGGNTLRLGCLLPCSFYLLWGDSGWPLALVLTVVRHGQGYALARVEEICVF